MPEAFVHIAQLNLRFRTKTILKDLSWNILPGEQWLLSGKSGSGKTVLAKVIAGLMHASGELLVNFNPDLSLPAKIMYVAQWSIFKDKQGGSNFYYQQRYNSQDSDQSDTVMEVITAYAKLIHAAPESGPRILQHFDLWDRRNAPLIQLSSGEHKKLQLTKALMLKPQLLILDNPYTGLDVQSRSNLNELLSQACQDGMQLIMISNDAPELPFINRYAQLEDGKIICAREAFVQKHVDSSLTKPLPAFLRIAPGDAVTELVKLHEVNVSYGEKKVLNNVSWTVNKGDKWLLSGHNGSGKSTLLSLLTGDNPQAYAQELYLFGKRRGTGETIWDIKRQIGFISPELQWYFDPGATLFQTIASGFFDTSGLFRTIGKDQAEKVRELLDFFDLEDEAETILKQLPIGKQRIGLLARAIIKNPPLLVLDEPCQGLDEEQTNLLNNLVDQLCSADRTLIYVGHFEDRLPTCINQRLTLDHGLAESRKIILEQEFTK